MPRLESDIYEPTPEEIEAACAEIRRAWIEHKLTTKFDKQSPPEYEKRVTSVGVFDHRKLIGRRPHE